MSSDERKAAVVLGILSDAVAAIDADRAPDGVVCAGLATLLGASAAVVVEVRAQGGSAVSYGWPDAAAASALAAYVTHAARVPTSDVATFEVHRIGGGEWSVLLCRVRPAGATRTHDDVGVVAFTRVSPRCGRPPPTSVSRTRWPRSACSSGTGWASVCTSDRSSRG